MRWPLRRSQDEHGVNGLDDRVNSEERLLNQARIPEEVRGYLRAVMDISRLNRTARLEVLRELVAHFEDGLAAGRTAEDLLEEFGDGRLVGTLIRRSRRETRWTPRHIGRWGDHIAGWAMGLARDFRQAMRGLRRTPGYAIVAVLTLALGVGANTAVFSVVNGVLLRPLPYSAAHELVLPVLTNPAENVFKGPVGYADYLRWRDETGVFQSVGLWYDWNLNVTGEQRPERLKGALVSHRYFDVFRAPPVLGRVFAPEEHERGAGKVAILSSALWQRRFGRDPAILGKTVFLDEEPYEIVGVVPPEAQWPRAAELWIPLTFGSVSPPDWVLERDHLGYSTIARLQPGVAIAQAATVVDQTARRAAVERPDTRAGYGATAIPLRTHVVGDNTPRTLWLLMGCVGFVLLIACANVANLALERSLGRQKEIALRAAIGAGRALSVRPLAFEFLLIALWGGLLGIAVALWCTDALVAMAPATLTEIHQLGLDLRLLVFGLVLSLATGVGFTLAPAFLAAKLDIRQALMEGSVRAGFGPSGGRARSTMSVIQIALSVILVLGASLAAKSTIGLLQTDPGFREGGVLSLKVFLPHYPPGSPEDRRIAQTYRAFTERLRALPGAVSAAAVSALPLSADGLFDNLPFQAEGRAGPSEGGNHFANWNIVGVEFFETLGISLSRGSAFSTSDREDSPRVAILSESFARELFPDQDAIGKRIHSTAQVVSADPIEVVGIVADVRYMDLADEGRNVIYVPQAQSAWRAMALVVRFEGDPSGRADEVRDAIWSVSPSAPVTEIRTMAALTAESLAAPRFVTTLVALFAALAVMLAVVGVYGVANVSFRQRYHELGIRKALGADGGHIGRLLVGQGAKLALVGVCLGLPVGIALTRLLSGLLFEVRPNDPAILISTPLLLGVCTVLAAAVPARRAARINPVEALRVE
jgi:putative ABC transport system permease protein